MDIIFYLFCVAIGVAVAFVAYEVWQFQADRQRIRRRWQQASSLKPLDAPCTAGGQQHEWHTLREMTRREAKWAAEKGDRIMGPPPPCDDAYYHREPTFRNAVCLACGLGFDELDKLIESFSEQKNAEAEKEKRAAEMYDKWRQQKRPASAEQASQQKAQGTSE